MIEEQKLSTAFQKAFTSFHKEAIFSFIQVRTSCHLCCSRCSRPWKNLSTHWHKLSPGCWASGPSICRPGPEGFWMRQRIWLCSSCCCLGSKGVSSCGEGVAQVLPWGCGSAAPEPDSGRGLAAFVRVIWKLPAFLLHRHEGFSQRPHPTIPSVAKPQGLDLLVGQLAPEASTKPRWLHGLEGRALATVCWAATSRAIQCHPPPAQPTPTQGGCTHMAARKSRESRAEGEAHRGL